MQMTGAMAGRQIDLAGHQTAEFRRCHESPRADVDELD
jgi:hypothetical protein